jgi:ribosomal protein S18 acetylase RimI-like enzyme
MSREVHVLSMGDEHRPWLAELLAREWGSPRIISRGKMHDALNLPGFVAMAAGAPVGVITYELAHGEAEIVTLNSRSEKQGVGTALVNAVQEAAISAGCRRLWLVTTNDNTDALGFYQRRGFRVVAIHKDAVTAARRQKPEIPMTGAHGIPIRDELELEMRL